MEIAVEFEGLEEALRKLRKFPPDMQAEIRKGMERGLLLIADEAKERAPVDTGRYRASIGAKGSLGILEVKGLGTELIGKVGTRVKYAPYIEFGRRPGRMPPPWAIEEWAARHGMAGMGFVIARAIGRRGIRAKNILENAARAKADAVVRLISRAVEDAARKF